MTVKKWVPCALWDVTGLEQWLGEMAAKGYALKDWHGASFVGRVSFQEDREALNARYRLDPIGERIGDLELRERSEAYQESGWRYVAKVGRLYAIYRCDDPTVPELYNDPESLAWAMKKQMRWMWVGLFLWLVWPAVLLRDELRLLFSYPAEFVMELILRADYLIPMYAFMLFFVISAVSDGIGTFLGIHRTRVCLHQGGWPPAGPRRYPEIRKLVLVAIVLAVSIVFLLYMGMSGKIRSSTALSGPQDWAFPHVLLEETLPEEVQIREYSDQEMLHFDKFQSSLLAPEQYNVAQGGMTHVDGAESKEARLYQEHYRAASPSLAQAIYYGRVAAHHHALEKYRKNWEENAIIHSNFPNAFDYIQTEEVPYSGLDGLTQFTYLYSDEETPNIVYIGLYKDRVFVLNCQGETNGESAISLLVERLLDSVDISA